jgi:hypothetical protein
MMVDTLDWSGRHQLMAIATDADQAEKSAITLGSAPIASGFDDEKAAGVFDDEITEHADLNEQDWEATEELVEVAEGDALMEIERRARILGDAYPFSLKGTSLHYMPSATGIYEFCLAASLAKSLQSKRHKPIITNFELIAADVVKAYLGEPADVIRTGWPSHDVIERPIRFKALFEIVAKRSGEWRWDPQPPNSDDPHCRTVKDGGVDFVAWKPMPDSRPGKLYVLGQCACGNDWSDKLDDLNKEQLERWFRPVTAAPFQRAFAMPRVVTGPYIFQELGRYAGLAFDRLRLVGIAEGQTAKFAHWKAKLEPATQLIIPTSIQAAA